MRTTALYVDILIIGILTLIWVCLFLCGNNSFAETLGSFFNRFSIVAGLFFLVLSYVLGIIMDYVNATLFQLFKSKEDKEFYKNHVSVIRILHKYPDVQKFLDMHYSRLRILRAVIVNTPFIMASVLFWILTRAENSELDYCHTIFFGSLIGIGFLGLAIFSYMKRLTTYNRYLEQTIEL
jgi:hypothetical protein